jgi:membrane protease subunit HflK
LCQQHGAVPDRYDFPPRRPADDPFADLRNLWEQFRSRFAGGGSQSRLSPYLIAAIALVLYALSGVFIVEPDERGVVLRFGRFAREAAPGPNYHLPWPFEQVIRPSVTQVRKEEFGFRTISMGPPARYQDVDREALMLTGDENIVKLQFIVQYRIKPEPEGARDFLFNLSDPPATLRDAAEAAMREVAGRTKIDDVLTEGRLKVEQEAQAVLQEILDRYDAGIEVATVKLQDVDPPDQVSDAFKDVISAQQDKERMINEARGYANDVVPKARGQAAQMLNEAEGYREATVREAAGVAQRFIALEEAYAQAKDVTRRRLYLETLEEVLPRVNKIVIDDVAGKQVVPYLPLESAIRRPAEAAPAGR